VLGRLSDHSSLALLKIVSFRHRPATTPLEINIYYTTAVSPPPPQTIIRGGDTLFVRYVLFVFIFGDVYFYGVVIFEDM